MEDNILFNDIFENVTLSKWVLAFIQYHHFEGKIFSQWMYFHGSPANGALSSASPQGSENNLFSSL